MIGRRARRRAIFLAIVAGLCAGVARYRRQAMDRNAQEFHGRYG